MSIELEHRNSAVSPSERTSGVRSRSLLRAHPTQFTLNKLLFVFLSIALTSASALGQATLDFMPRPDQQDTASSYDGPTILEGPLAVASSEELALRERERVRRPVAHRPVPIWAGAITADDEREVFAAKSRKRIAARYQVLAYDQQCAPDTYLEPTLEAVEDQPEPVVIRPRPIWEIELDEDCDSPGFYHRDLIARVEPKLSQRASVLARILGKMSARHLRKAFRDELNGRREEDLRMTEIDYLEERARISRVGRGGTEAPDFLADSRMDILDDQDVDEDINLLEWGPLVLDDRGRVGVDLDRLSRGVQLSGNRIDLANADDEDPRGESLFQDRTIRIDTDVKLSPRVQHFTTGDIFQGIGRVRPQIELDFYDPIFERRYMAIELEGRLDPDGDHAVFLNISLLEY